MWDYNWLDLDATICLALIKVTVVWLPRVLYVINLLTWDELGENEASSGVDLTLLSCQH